MDYSAEIPGFTMSMSVETKDGAELRPMDFAQAEFVVGIKTLASIIADRHNVSESDVLTWLANLGEQATGLLEGKE